MNWHQRLENYEAELPSYPRHLFVGGDGRVYGTFIMGGMYEATTDIYGSYPYGYLARIKALFPDKRRVLHLFSGLAGRIGQSVLPGLRVDLNAEHAPDIIDDAHTLKKVPVEDYDLICCDPPYHDEAAERYGFTLVRRNIVMRTLANRLQAGAHIAWLDQMHVVYRKAQFDLEGAIGMVISTNHRFRMVSIYGCQRPYRVQLLNYAL